MISRRHWLRSVGLGAGAAMFAPFLRQVAHAQGEAPRRFVFIVEGNGFEPVTVLGAPARAALDATMAQPIDTQRWWDRRYAHDAPLTVAGGLDTAPALAGFGDLADRAAVVFGLSSKITGGGHSAQHGVLSSTRTTAGKAGGPTIDAWLAARPEVRQQTPFDAIRLGVSNDPAKPLDFGTCAYAPGKSAPMMLQPDRAYLALFGSVAGGDAGAAFARRGAQLDFAVADVDATLAAFAGSSVERAKLEAYLTSLEDLRARRARLVEIGPALDAARPDVGAAAGTALGRFAQQLELAAAALMGGLTNVCVVGCGSGGDFGMAYPEVINGIGRHDLHHTSAANPASLAAIHEVTRLQAEAIAATARRLAAAPDLDGGSLLDNTVIVWIGDNGEQHHSTASDFPIVLLGGEGLGLRTGGRTVVYPGLRSGGHRQVSNLWNTLGYLAGGELDHFGREGPNRMAPGPLGELWG